ncbi:hypothetical protein LX36DRAFT_319799 [Colletotrichum falcatum]|nr:hypothetical protein LX36DRAFT_319799 [Colletotrichum falcatum]
MLRSLTVRQKGRERREKREKAKEEEKVEQLHRRRQRGPATDKEIQRVRTDKKQRSVKTRVHREGMKFYRHDSAKCRLDANQLQT